eukprot:1189761-Prorocentrum_minimum.AAC.1
MQQQTTLLQCVSTTDYASYASHAVGEYASYAPHAVGDCRLRMSPTQAQSKTMPRTPPTQS